MSIRKKYSKKVERALLDGNVNKAVDMIMAIMSGDVEKATKLYMLTNYQPTEGNK